MGGRIDSSWLLVPLLLAAGCATAPPESEEILPAFPDAPVGAAWPGWGGPGGDFTVSTEDLAASWGPDGPVRAWSRELGEGYSGIAAAEGRLFTMYREGDRDVVIALDADDGETLWSRDYAAPTGPENVTQFGSGPNATPLVAGGRVVTLGYTGILAAWEVKTGEPLWRRDLVEEMGGRPLEFGYSASPILDEGRLIVLVGGAQQAVGAFDPDTGELLWGSPPGDVSYATPVAIDVGGQRQIVYLAPHEVVGIDASDGRRLWDHPCKNKYRNNATGPIWGQDGLLWVPTQGDGGARVLHLLRDGDETRVEEVWFDPKIAIHFWNSVRVGRHVYASIGPRASTLACIDVRTGEVLWQEDGFEQLNLLRVGDARTLGLTADGMLVLLDLTPEGMRLLAQARIVDEVTWTPPTLIGTRLYVRDEESIRALKLGREAYEGGSETPEGQRKREVA